jgi:hypothetical protein
MARTNPNTGSTSTGTSGNLTDMIRKKAYELYQKRGCKAGHSMDDWLEAERIVKQKQRSF